MFISKSALDKMNTLICGEDDVEKKMTEEENKIKGGDLVRCSNKNSNAKCVIGIVEDLHLSFIGVGGHWYDKFEKISDTVLPESLNRLF